MVIRNAPLIQVVVARTSDPEQNYFSDEFDGEGLNIDEVRRQSFFSFRYTFHLPLVLVFVLHLVPLLSLSGARKFDHSRYPQAAVRQMLQALPLL